MKLYDEDGNEVEAFTQADVDTKISAATKEGEEAKTALETKTAELEKLTKLHEDKSTSYTELLKKNKEYETAEKESKEKVEGDYADAVKAKVKELAGDDKEYAKELTKQLEREGIKEVTNDADSITRQIKEAKALTDSALEREVNANPIDGSGGAPEGSNDNKNFTETTEGKDTFEALQDMMGLPPEVKEEK
jgi:chromosome segregation ATPase